MVQDQCKIFINNMLHKLSKGSSNKATKELRTKAKEGPSLLSYEHKFAELAAFQANTIVFQANTNASLKNLDT